MSLYCEEFLGGKKETNERDKAKIKFVLKYGYFWNIVNFKKDYYSKSKDIHSDFFNSKYKNSFNPLNQI